MRITQEQKVIMRNQKIQLILLARQLSSINCKINNPNYSFINEYVINETKQIDQYMKKIDIFMKCDYNVQKYDEQEIAQYIETIECSLKRINNYLM